VKWAEGQTLVPLAKPAITRAQLSEYAEASGDHNPIHLDEAFAKEAGFPSVIVHGMLSMAFLADFLSARFPDTNFQVQRLKTRFRKVTFPGDELVCEGKVKKINSDGSLVISAWTQNQRGELSCEAEADILPR